MNHTSKLIGGEHKPHFRMFQIFFRFRNDAGKSVDYRFMTQVSNLKSYYVFQNTFYLTILIYCTIYNFSILLICFLIVRLLYTPPKHSRLLQSAKPGKKHLKSKFSRQVKFQFRDLGHAREGVDANPKPSFRRPNSLY